MLEVVWDALAAIGLLVTSIVALAAFGLAMSMLGEAIEARKTKRREAEFLDRCRDPLPVNDAEFMPRFPKGTVTLTINGTTCISTWSEGPDGAPIDA